MMLDKIFQYVNDFFVFLGPITNGVWDFPTNIAFYRHIPILGQFSFPVILLLGVGVYFSIRTQFIQGLTFRRGITILFTRQHNKVGISALGTFLLGLAMRIGPGNIVGITGAIAIGGPGALFWMWVAAFFGMASAFTEATLAQLYKERKGDQFVGGLPFYGERLLNNHRFVGIFLSIVFVTYALFNIPAQTFNIFSAVSSIAKISSGIEYGRRSILYYSIAITLVTACAFIIFGGIRRVVAYFDFLVPVKAAIFCLISLFVIVINFPVLPYFFKEVFVGAFLPQSIFGATIGTVLAQGVKRGLMSNEAGQGTITMAAAVASSRHPCEQGLVQALGVFFDTMVICTLTGFIVVMAHIWTGQVNGVVWDSIKQSQINLYLTSLRTLTPMWLQIPVQIIMSAAYGLFAFTTLLGMISFAEISANFISRSAYFIFFIRTLGSFIFVPFGTLTILTGLQLGNLWYLSDLTNIIMVYLNVPLLLIGLPVVLKTLQHYRNHPEKRFVSKAIGIETSFWK